MYANIGHRPAAIAPSRRAPAPTGQPRRGRRRHEISGDEPRWQQPPPFSQSIARHRQTTPSCRAAAFRCF